MYAANFGYSYMSALCITGKGLESRRSRETARPEDSDHYSGSSDNWIMPDGAYLYQIYGSASKLVGYGARTDGSLRKSSA